MGDYVYTGDEPRETIPVKVGGGELVRWSFLLHGTLITEGGERAVLSSLLCLQACDRVVRYVEFRFHSNHGNENYTCVYRLRVHGHLPSTEGQS